MQLLKTVHSKVTALIIMSLLLSLASFVTTYLIVQTHYGDEAAVELVHSKITLLQKLTWLALNGGSQSESQAMVFEIDQTLEQVRLEINQITTVIPFRTPDDILLHLNALEASWGNYQLALDSLNALSLQDASRPPAEQKLNSEALQMFTQTTALSHALESFSSSQHEMLLRLQVMFVMISFLGALLGYLLVRQRVVKPFSILNGAARRIQKGILNEPLVLAGEDEIAQLASSFNQMRIAVLENQTNLEKRIHERTSEILAAFEFSQEIVSHHNIDDLVQSVIVKARTLMSARDAFLCLVTPDGCSAELASTTSAHADENKLVQPIGDNLPDLVLPISQPLSSSVSSFGCAFLQHTPEDQCLSASLRVGDQLLGAMCVIRDKEQPFSADESRAFTLLVNSAAVALLNARYEMEARQRARDVAVLSERERLASELHDNLAQALNTVNLKVSQLHTIVDQPDGQVVHDEVAAVSVGVQEAISQVRMFASELASATRLKEDHFLTQLQSNIEELEATSEICVELIGTDMPFDDLPALAQKQLFMIIREALTNVQRHAEAERVSIRFSADQQSLRVTIEDDGKGFQPKSVQGDQHLGLRIMRTRAERSGGSLELISSPGAGTRVTVTFPLTVQEAA